MGSEDERPEDERLLIASRTEAELFVAFYDHHAARQLAFFARRTFDAQVAADLTVETMAEAFASRGRFADRGPESAAAWLYTIGRRQLSHFVARRRVEDRARRRLGMAPLVLQDEEIERIEELIDFESVGRDVAAALGRLRAGQREALTLRVIEGRSYPGAARILGCSEAVVRARVSRGLRQLAAELGL